MLVLNVIINERSFNKVNAPINFMGGGGGGQGYKGIHLIDMVKKSISKTGKAIF